jgi:hypothetical protein
VAEIEPGEFGKAAQTPRDPDKSRAGTRGGTMTNHLGQFATARGSIRASFARVSTVGARAVIVLGLPGSGRSSLLDQAGADIVHAGFEIHRLRVVTGSERNPNEFVDRLIATLVERHGIDAIRSAIPVRARELLERVGGPGPVSNARPRDPLASRQYEEQVWRGAAELLRELARQRPLALVVDDRDQTATAATGVVSLLLRLLGKAQVFILCTAGAGGADESDPSDKREPRIDYVRLPPLNRSRLNELLESRGVAALPVALADALVAHVRDGRASLESIAGWLQAQGDSGEQAPDGLARPSIDRRMKRVEPNTTSRRPRFGTA